MVPHFDGLVQDCSKSIANALELLQSYTKSSICKMAQSNMMALKQWQQ